MSGSLEVRCWSEAEFLASEAEWSQLLAASACDRLFMSWDWQTLWWRFFGEGELNVVAVRRAGRLIGLAPLYVSRLKRRRIPVRSLQMIGSRWCDQDALISEYLDVIADVEHQEVVGDAVLQVLREQDWSEWVMVHVRSDAGWNERMAKVNGYVRRVNAATAYQADLSAGYGGYLQALGQSSRRSLWGLRKRLTARGPVRLENVSLENMVGGFADLNRLHALRWGQPVFAGPRLEFHQTLAARLAARKELRLSRLIVNETVVSVLYDVRIGARQYNVQMGFDPEFESRVSLGLLHLGYAMEDAASSGISTYDFLAGDGRTANYKRHISQKQVGICSVQCLRGAVLSKIYRLHDVLRTRTPVEM